MNTSECQAYCESSKLRNVHEKLGLTMGDVEAASQRLAHKHSNEAYLITPGRLSDFEIALTLLRYYILGPWLKAGMPAPTPNTIPTEPIGGAGWTLNF